MTIEFKCTGCSYPFKVPDSMAGKKGKCPKCGVVTPIPTETGGAVQTGPSKKSPAGIAANPDDGGAFDDMDDAPRSKKKKKKSKMGLIIGASIGGVLLLAGLGIGIYMLMGGGGLGDDMKFMPSDAQMIFSVRIEQGVNSAVWKDLRKSIPQMESSEKDFEKQANMPITDIERVTVGGSTKSDQPIVVVTSKKTVKATDIQNSMSKAKGGSGKFSEKKVGSYTMYENESEFGESFAIIGGKTVVAGRAKDLKTVLERNKKPDFSAGMQKALDKADFSKTISFALDVKDADDRAKKGMTQGIQLPGASEAINGIDAVAGYMHAGSDIDLNVTIMCKDAASAEKVKKAGDDGKNLAKIFLPPDILDAIKMVQNGATVAVTGTIKVAPLLKLAK